MRSNSINICVVLTVFVAVTSAFSLKPASSKLLDIYSVWGIYPSAVPNPDSDPADLPDLNCGISEVLYCSFSSLGASGYSTLQQFKQRYTNGFLTCSSHNDYVCMAYVAYDLGMPTNGLVLDIIEGDFSHYYW